VKSRFLLLLGPSGVGKSTLIRELINIDARFNYISPYITRPLRDGEFDKVSITDLEMDEMKNTGEFVVINEIYGIRYATPRTPILAGFEEGNFPILDWPIDKLQIMQDSFERLYSVYIAPPSVEELERRLNLDERGQNDSRLQNAKAELVRFHAGDFEGMFDISVVSESDSIPQLSQHIYQQFLLSLEK
jgi:guanylate kinase